MNTTLEKPENKKSNNSSLDIIEFDPRSLELDHLFELWREGLKPLFICEMKEDHDARHIHHKMVKIDQIIVAKGRFSSQLFVRDRCYKHLIYGNVKRSQITQIAQYWGFSNRQQSTRQFKQYFGVSPSDVVAFNADNLTHRFNHRSKDDIEINSYRLASWLKSLGHTAKG